METFTESVHRKDLKDLFKLDYLKMSVAGKAFEAMRNYSHSDQFLEVI